MTAAPNGTATAEACLAWYALQVRSPREATVEWKLQTEGFDVYLPTYRYVSRWSDRTKVIGRPLFPGYLFARLDPHRHVPVLRGIIRILGIGDEPTPLEDGEITGIRQLLASPLAIAPCEYTPIEAGQVVSIQWGPFVGYEGTVQRIRGTSRAIVTLEMLRRSISVELPSEALRFVRSASAAVAAAAQR